MSTPGVTAVIAQTKDLARLLADALGVDRRWAFGSTANPATFEGLRASRVLIERDAVVPDAFMSVIEGTVLKMPDGGGKIFRVTVQAAH